MNKINLKEIEKKAFRATFQDGLWDIFVGLVMAQFAITPFINDLGFGDFWSSFMLLPFYVIILIFISLGKKFITAPRIGMIEYGSVRKRKISKLLFVMIFMLLLGILASALVFIFHDNKSSLWIFPALFSVVVFVSFSAGAYFLDLPRFYLYGILLAFAIPIGEILYQFAGASHHGFPISFGISGVIIIANGTALFIRFLNKYPLQKKDSFNE